jgi:hypothetical protein
MNHSTLQDNVNCVFARILQLWIAPFKYIQSERRHDSREFTAIILPDNIGYLSGYASQLIDFM